LRFRGKISWGRITWRHSRAWISWDSLRFSLATLRRCWLRSSKVHWPVGIWKVNPWPMGFEIAEANNSDHNSGERELNG
jgi:hypothetical protein